MTDRFNSRPCWASAREVPTRRAGSSRLERRMDNIMRDLKTARQTIDDAKLAREGMWY